MKIEETKEKIIKIEIESRILSQQLKLIENGKINSDEYKELERKYDVVKYGISIQDLIDKL